LLGIEANLIPHLAAPNLNIDRSSNVFVKELREDVTDTTRRSAC